MLHALEYIRSQSYKLLISGKTGVILMSASPEQIIQELGPYETGPIKIEVSVSYEKGFLGGIKHYSFSYYWRQFGIHWDQYGNIQEFDGDIFSLFTKCRLDSDDLRNKMARFVANVPEDKQAAKEHLSSFNSQDNYIYIYFKNEDWRRDYWFCEDDNKMVLETYLEKETRFIIQWSSAKLHLKLTVGRWERDFEITSVPGKKGVYDFSNIGYSMAENMQRISNRFKQFGFSFSDALIDSAIARVKSERNFSAVIKKNANGTTKQIDENVIQPSDYKELLDFEEEHFKTAYTLKYRLIPSLAAFYHKYGDIDYKSVIDNQDTIDNYIDEVRSANTKSSQYNDDVCFKFIKASFMETILTGLSPDDLMARYVLFVSKHSQNTVKTVKTIIKQTLLLTVKISDKACRILEIFSEYNNNALSPTEIAQLIEDAGYGNFGWEYLERKKNYNTDNQSNLPDEKQIAYYFSVLHLTPDAGLEEVKKAYHVQAMKFHPDKLAGKGLDQDFIDLAKEKFQQIDEAYKALVEYLS